MSNVLRDQIGLVRKDAYTYTAGYSSEWTIGPVLHGGSIAAILYSAAQAHFTTTLASCNQPDVHTLNIVFPRGCTASPSIIKVTDIKTGKGSCFIQLDLSQGGQVKCTALATSTDLSSYPGPTAQTNIPMSPALPPKPDFARLENQEADQNWLPSSSDSELLNFSKRLTYLYPAEGQTTPGIIDYWCVFNKPERFDGTHLAMLGDLGPSMSDTLLRTVGIFDALRLHALMKETAAETPGKPTILKNSLKEGMKAKIWNTTLTLDMQFKRRMREEEMMWTFNRVTTRMMEGGRMDLDFAIYDRDMIPICLARQVMQVIDAGRRFKKDANDRASKI